eukprot:scaffold4746_cov136-Skeletonema_marinoi.AAC.2
MDMYAVPSYHLIKVVFTAVYGFGDASGKGFGSTVGDGKKDVSYHMGIWGKDIEDESSNYRELRNLVETAEEEARKGNLSNTEFFLFTDNSTAESGYGRVFPGSQVGGSDGRRKYVVFYPITQDSNRAASSSTGLGEVLDRKGSAKSSFHGRLVRTSPWNNWGSIG